MYPELFKIGPITIHSFGVMAMLGFLACTLLLRREYARMKINPDHANNIIIAAIIGGFVGARLYFIIEHWSDFLADPVDMIFSGAGLVWFGGFLGGAIGVIWMLRRNRLPMLKSLDILGVLVLLGHAIGRIGCQLAGDGDYGPPSDLPWAMAYPNGVVPTPVPVHPTPIYDFILLISFFSILWILRHRVKIPGQLFGLALVAMGVERFITEFFRTTPKLAFGWMTLAQIISVGLILAGVSVYLMQQRGRQTVAANASKTSA